MKANVRGAMNCATTNRFSLMRMGYSEMVLDLVSDEFAGTHKECPTRGPHIYIIHHDRQRYVVLDFCRDGKIDLCEKDRKAKDVLFLTN